MKRRSLNPWAAVLMAVLLLGGVGTVFFAESPTARGDEKDDARATKALAESVARGKALWRQVWRRGEKGCFACHTRGPNKMAARRLRTYPKYDKEMGKVVSARQKINHMIHAKSKGKGLDLGNDDLTALEAYIATLK